MTGYLIMKTIHILAAIVFLGNIIVGIHWKRQADRAKDAKIAAHTWDSIIRADRTYTMPSVTLLFLVGFGAQGMGHYPITATWILWGIILLVLSGVVFMARVVPVQKKLAALARSGDISSAQYMDLDKQWMLWGTVATLLPIAAVVLMVWKPA